MLATRKRKIETNRQKDARRKATERILARDLHLPAVVDPRRRKRGLEEPEFFLRTYWPEKFFNPFTDDQLTMINCLVERILYGGRQAMAAPRGDGKSSIIEGIAGIWAIVYGLRKFVGLIAATQDDGSARIGSVMEQYETNDELLADFPEICFPIRALEGSPRRGLQQTVDGNYTRIMWGTGRKTTEVRFPTVAGSKASGSYLLARGIGGAMLGLVRGKLRPDLVIMDDVETEASVDSPVETNKIRKTITKTIVPMAGQDKRIALFFPCTIRGRNCIADDFTDRSVSPAWMGLRYRFVVQWPDCHGKPGEADLWAVYRTMRQRSQNAGDETARQAHRFYLGHRAAMDAGAIISNPHRFDRTALPDGSQIQVSALQMIMDWISDAGNNDEAWAAFQSEFQNEPSDVHSPQGSGCSEDLVMHALSGIPRGFCPPGVTHLTAGIDVQKYELFWVVIAWVGSSAFVIDYGVQQVHSPRMSMRGDAEVTRDVQTAIGNALVAWRESIAKGWPVFGSGTDGAPEMKLLDRALVDTRWQPHPIYEFVRTCPRPTWGNVTGDGSAKGQDAYRQPVKTSKTSKIGGYHHYLAYQHEHKAWLIHADSDFWKTHLHTGVVLRGSLGADWKPNTPGSVSVYGTDALAHRDLASHWMAEEYVEQFITGKGRVGKWVQRRANNHWLDAGGYAFCAAALAGVVFAHGSGRTAGSSRRRGAVQVAGTVKRFRR